MATKIIQADVYKDIVNGVDGNVYVENLGIGYDFLSRCKKNCRTLVDKVEKEINGIKYITDFYEIRTYDVKQNVGSYYKGKNYCKNCKSSTLSTLYHFPECKINKDND